MGKLQPWANTPYDSNLAPETQNFFRWLQTSINGLIGTLFPLAAPDVSTKGFTGAVQVLWNEIAGAGYYVVYATDDQNLPTNDPIAIVPANRGGTQNSALHSGINDANTRYYWVQPFAPNGTAGKIGGPTSGKASAFIPTGLSGSLLEIGIDSALQQIRQDFLGGTNNTGSVGEFGFGVWVKNAGSPRVINGSYPFIGVFQLRTTSSGGVNTNGNGVFLANYGLTGVLNGICRFDNLPSTATFKWQMIARTNFTTNESIRIGLGIAENAQTESAFDPPDALWFRYDTLTGYGDTVWKAECRTRIYLNLSVTSIARATNVVTVTTSAAHGLSTGQTIVVYCPEDNSFSGQFAIASTPTSTTFTYSQTASNATVSPTATRLSLAVKAISRTTNVTTVTTGTPHGLTAGQTIVVCGCADPTFNGVWSIATVPTSTTFTYNNTGANATPGAAGVRLALTTIVSTGAAPITTGFLRFEIYSTAPGEIRFLLSPGGTEIVINSNLPQIELNPIANIITRAAEEKTLDIDYIGLGFNLTANPDPSKARWV